MDISEHKRAVVEMHITSAFWGLVFGIFMGTVALKVVGELFQSPYPQVMMGLMFFATTLYIHRMWFNRLFRGYMRDVEKNLETDSEALG